MHGEAQRGLIKRFNPPPQDNLIIGVYRISVAEPQSLHICTQQNETQKPYYDSAITYEKPRTSTVGCFCCLSFIKKVAITVGQISLW